MSILDINAYHGDLSAVLLSACAVHLPAALRRRHGADRRDGEPGAAVEEELFRRVGKGEKAGRRGKE